MSAAAVRAALAGVLLLSAPSPAGAQAGVATCSISYSASEAMTALIKAEGLVFDGYDRLCRVMTAHDLRLRIDSGNGVLSERAYGWVRVSLERKTTGVEGGFYRTSIRMSREPTTPEARSVMYVTLNDALGAIAERPDEYIASVEEQEARLRRTLAAKR